MKDSFPSSFEVNLFLFNDIAEFVSGKGQILLENAYIYFADHFVKETQPIWQPRIKQLKLNGFNQTLV